MSIQQPLVSIICLCYNHELYVEEALHSVLNQTYENIELIIVDDASTDKSVDAINRFLKDHPKHKFISLPKNVGNCTAFNIALKHASGHFIIDLAADDILMDTRVEEGIKSFSKAGEEYGVHFSDALYIDGAGTSMQKHSDRFPHSTIPQGDIYKHIIDKYFICPPTVMFRKTIIDKLGGYDETLAYEDFDFWIRSSRITKYCYSPLVLVKKRVLKSSLSSKQFSMFSPQLYSTFKICEKILHLNQTQAEQKALRRRIFYEIKVAARLLNFHLVIKYFILLLKNSSRRYS